MKMCESSVYVLKDGKEELVLESLDLLETKGGQIKMVSIYGEERTIKAKVKSLSLVDHKIILELGALPNISICFLNHSPHSPLSSS